MPVLKNISKLYQCKPDGGQGQVHQIENAAIAWVGEKITWVGKEEELPGDLSAEKELDADGKLVIPGLIDCHTHLAFGGWRQNEFVMRVQGKSYLEIQKAGGGITNSMKSLRTASKDELVKHCLNQLSEVAKLGVTTVECKSGYGLSYEDEIKTLEAYEEVKKQQPLSIVSTLLAAHVVPPEFKEDRAGYIKLVVEKIIPEVSERKLAKFCDVFLEDSAFSFEESKQILEAGISYGLIPKIHADQLTDSGGAKLAAELMAASADHLECSAIKDLRAMGVANVTAVTLPIASLYTFQKPLDARPLIEEGIKVAVATDFNPGSAPSFHLPFAMILACTMNRMTPAEVLKGATIYAAKALLLDAEIGSLEVGKAADLAVIDAESIEQWIYNFHANACSMTIKSGGLIWE